MSAPGKSPPSVPVPQPAPAGRDSTPPTPTAEALPQATSSSAARLSCGNRAPHARTRRTPTQPPSSSHTPSLSAHPATRARTARV
eukprot:4950037-Prymnesium_polylepis.1